jgi:hypothetical protein
VKFPPRVVRKQDQSCAGSDVEAMLAALSIAWTVELQLGIILLGTEEPIADNVAGEIVRRLGPAEIIERTEGLCN